MKKKSKTVIYIGNERLATGVTTEAPTLSGLISAGYEVSAVVTSHRTATSRSPRALEVARIADKNGILLFIPAGTNELRDKIRSLQPDIGVLAAFGKIVPQEIIDLFPFGIINIHPSLLPLHRGPTPIESVILNDEQKTGVSIMRLSQKMDAGPVFAQSEIKLIGTETKQVLADKLAEIGGAMLLDLLPEIISGKVVAMPQDESEASYDGLILKQDGLIDWHKPAERIEREIRAYAGWPNSRSVINGKEIIITQAQVETNQSGPPGSTEVIDKQPLIHCGRGSLRLLAVKPAGKKEMSGKEFIAGNPF